MSKIPPWLASVAFVNFDRFPFSSLLFFWLDGLSNGFDIYIQTRADGAPSSFSISERFLSISFLFCISLFPSILSTHKLFQKNIKHFYNNNNIKYSIIKQFDTFSWTHVLFWYVWRIATEDRRGPATEFLNERRASFLVTVMLWQILEDEFDGQAF